MEWKRSGGKRRITRIGFDGKDAKNDLPQKMKKAQYKLALKENTFMDRNAK